jgi:HMG box factor, other
MVMTIPYINKIKVINRISPPLSAPGPLSPPFQIRGAIIAVDGNDPSTTDKLFRWLEEALKKSGEYAVKSFEAPLNQFERYESLRAQGQLGRGDNQYFVEYLGEIIEWHRRSEEIVRHVTQEPEEDKKEKEKEENDSPPHPAPPRHPISLIPHYILTRSNTAASHIPINDRYAPIDHWQWMATLWRGCVGPDITIYAKDDCSPDEIATSGAVEMRADAGAVVARRLKNDSVWPDRVLRRLGFEVGEWVRSGEGWGGTK